MTPDETAEEIANVREILGRIFYNKVGFQHMPVSDMVVFVRHLYASAVPLDDIVAVKAFYDTFSEKSKRS